MRNFPSYSMQLKSGLSVSVVIACHTEDRWALLVQAIGSVKRQSLAASEIIVVVDHNQPLLERLRDTYADVIVLANDSLPGASGARNTGAFYAGGEYVAFLDDDACAETDWLVNIAAPFVDPEVVGTGGRVLPAWHNRRPSWFPEEFDWVVGASYVGMPTGTEPIRNVWGENMAVRKDAFVAVNGFRTGFGKIGGHSRPEDTDLCIRMSAQAPGFHWVYEYDAVVSHYVPPGRATYGFFLRRTYHEGRGKAELARLLPTPSAALSSERGYVRRTLPAGVVRHAFRALRTTRAGELGRSVNIVVGLACTVWGFAVQKMVDRIIRRPVVLVESDAPLTVSKLAS
ncbi:MAG: family 2 glycosyl transferase [Pseudonocardiales bacterium]|nr:family 2 glycosyl transferase [Pseudonocardiales bacterium]